MRKPSIAINTYRIYIQNTYNICFIWICVDILVMQLSHWVMFTILYELSTHKQRVSKNWIYLMKYGTSQISRWQKCFKMFNAYVLVHRSAETSLNYNHTTSRSIKVSSKCSHICKNYLEILKWGVTLPKYYWYIHIPYRNLNYNAQKFAMVLSSLNIHGINGSRTLQLSHRA